MPPKKVMMEETIKEMNETLKKLTQDIRDVVAKQTEITNLLAESENSEKVWPQKI